MRLNGRRAEGGQVVLVGEYLFMRDDGHSGVAQIQPVGDLTVSHNVDVTYPWRKTEKGPNGIPQLVVV